jgi:hypothetical protein
MAALQIKKRDPITGFYYQQRADKGFDFYNNNNQKINVNQYVQATGTDKNKLVQSFANAGDTYSKVYLENPRLKAPQIESLARTKRVAEQAKGNIFNPIEIGKDIVKNIIVSPAQQTGGILGDIAVQGGAVLDEVGRNTNPFINDKRRNEARIESVKNTENIRNQLKGLKTVTGEDVNPYQKDFQWTDNKAGDLFDLAGRSLAAGVSATGVIPSAGAVRAVTQPIKTAQNVGKSAKAVVAKVEQSNPRIAQIDETLNSYKKAFDAETNVKRRQQINKGIADLNAERRRVLTRGSIQLGTNKAKVALKNVAKSGKKERLRADEFAKGSIPVRQQAADFISNNFTDDTAYFQALDREIARNQGKKVRNLPASESLDANIQSYRYAPSQMEQRYKDLGITDFAKKLSNQADYDTYRIYRTFKTGSERAAQNTKRGESIEDAYARFTGGRDYDADRQSIIDIDANTSKFNDLFNEEVGINRAILRDRGANPDLTLSPDDAEALIRQNPNYTPLTREISEDVQQFTRNGRVGSQQGANVKKLKEGSKSRPIEDPLQALMANADELVKKGQANKVSNILVKNFGAKLRPLVTEADLIAKEKAVISMAELGRDAKEVASAIRNNRNLASRLSKEIRLAEQASGSSKVTLKQDPSQVTLRLANMSDNQYRRLTNNLRNQTEEYDNLINQIDLLRQRADDIKSDRLGIIRSGDLNAFETNANKNVLRRVVNGREEVYEITDARLAQNLANLGGRELSQAAKVLGVPTRIFKFFTTGAGNVIGFAPVALTRDILSTILFARAPIRSIADPRSWIDAFKSAAMKGELFEELQRRGIGGTMIEGSRAVKNATSASLRNTGAKRAKVYTRSPGQAFRDLEGIEMATERFSRSRLASAEYRKSLSRYSKDPNLTPEQAKDMAFWDAAREYREGMLNFGRAGKVTRELNAFSAYLNPAVQAGNKVRRTIRENPFGSAVRAGVATSLIAGAWAYSNSSADQKAIYDEISDEDKQNNIIIVPPNASRDPDTGKVSGVIKIPLPQEYYVFSDAIRGMFEGAEAQEFGDIALSGLAALSGLSTQSGNELIGQLLPTNLKPIIENATNYSFFTGEALTPDYVKDAANGDKTKESRNGTSGTAKWLSEQSGGAFNPIEAENIIRGFTGGATKDLLGTSDALLGATGAIDKEDVTASDPFTRIRKRYTEAYGESEGVKFFNELERISESITNQDDRAAFNLLHEKDSSPGILDSAEKAQIFLSRPEVVKKERELNSWNVRQGKPSNPLFELNDNELQKVLAYRSAKMLNAGKQTYDKNGNSLFTSLGLDDQWYEEFRDKETNFYDTINKESLSKAKKELSNDPNNKELQDEVIKLSKKVEAIDDEYSGETFSGAPRIKPSKELKEKLDYYYKLPKGTGARSNFIRANPEILAYWEASDGFANKERAAIGLKPLEDEESNSFGGKGGKSSGDSSADAYKYAVSLKAGGSAPEAEKNRVKNRKFKKTAVSFAGKRKPKVTIRKGVA